MNILRHVADSCTTLEKGLRRCGPTVHNNLYKAKHSVYEEVPHVLRQTDQFSGGDFWNDCFGRPAIVEPLKVNEEQATGKLYLHDCGDIF